MTKKPNKRKFLKKLFASIRKRLRLGKKGVK